MISDSDTSSCSQIDVNAFDERTGHCATERGQQAHELLALSLDFGVQCVKGQLFLPVGGQRFCHWWPSQLPDMIASSGAAEGSDTVVIMRR